MKPVLLATLLGMSGLAASAAQAQYAAPPYPDDHQMPSYDYDQTPYKGGYSDSYSSTDARRDQQGYPPPAQYRQAPPPSAYRGAPPYGDEEDAAHIADRNRTAALNRSHVQDGGRYADQQATYQQQLDQHRRAMEDYRYARSRYADRIAEWRARADACEAGNIDACDGPE